jgi:DMSO/TMAO reductase YedYZ heme-binding membrane subunit
MNQSSIAKNYFLKILTLSFLYAFIRYFIFKEVPYTRIPLWITNKALALSSTIFIITSIIWDKQKPRKQIGLIGLFTALLHCIMSLALLRPAYYAKFFQVDQTFTLSGELSLLAGAITIALLLIAAFYSFPALQELNNVDLLTINKYVMLAIMANLIHLVFMGYNTWIDPSTWPNFMPPVSLIATIICLLGILFKKIKS